jgi:glycerol-3-phosphate dehydrogenase
MTRDLARMAATAHDLIVVGGGLHGTCIAWDATLRGLRVALIERDTLGAATSRNSLRIVHGGLRYLARGDLRRMRESVRERTTLLRIAPSLVEPLPVLVPTTGHGLHGRSAMRAALHLTDLLSPDRNSGLDPAHVLPSSRLLGISECRRLFPAFPAMGASGGALWHDARLRDPEALARALASSAERLGAQVAEHCAMDRVLGAEGVVIGVAATDRLTGSPVEIRGRAVVLAAGPWTAEIAGEEPTRYPNAFALNIEVAGRLADVAVGVRTRTSVEDDPVVGGRRFVFLHPQERTTLLGTWYALPGASDVAELVTRGTAALLAEWRDTCPALPLAPTSVIGVQWGWLPLKQGREVGRPTALADRPRVVDHGRQGGLRGMFSVEGVKFTTMRRLAEWVADAVVDALGGAPAVCRTAHTRVDEGDEGIGLAKPLIKDSGSAPEGLA